MSKKAAIYHFTNNSEKRPSVYLNQLDCLVNYANSFGFERPEIYCDKSLRKNEQPEFNRFLSSSDKYDALFTKDYYHLSKNTKQCFTLLSLLLQHNMLIFSTDNGCIVTKPAPFDQKLKVATYLSITGEPKETEQLSHTKNDILSLFISKKTNWSLIKQYYDICPKQIDKEQIQLSQLIQDANQYDLILVHAFKDLHWRTANFFKIRLLLKLDIYSLQEDLLLGKEDSF